LSEINYFVAVVQVLSSLFVHGHPCMSYHTVIITQKIVIYSRLSTVTWPYPYPLAVNIILAQTRKAGRLEGERGVSIDIYCTQNDPPHRRKWPHVATALFRLPLRQYALASDLASPVLACATLPLRSSFVRFLSLLCPAIRAL
jgi:hypothetical protein